VQPGGEWVLKVASVPEASKCGKGKASRKVSDQRLTIVKGKASFEVRDAGPLVEAAHLRFAVNDLGGCSLHYEFTENIVPSGSPLYHGRADDALPAQDDLYGRGDDVDVHPGLPRRRSHRGDQLQRDRKLDPFHGRRRHGRGLPGPHPRSPAVAQAHGQLEEPRRS
jgi:hypothetical protein